MCALVGTDVARTRAESDLMGQDPATPPAGGGSARSAAVSLFWWLVLVNVVVLGIGAVLLIATPVRITPDIAVTEAAIVVAGFLTMAAISLVLLRGVLAPVRRLAAAIREIDPARPGRRLDERDARYAEIITVAHALNAMLDRLEDERRETTRRVIEAQEAERARIARELHDDIGQTLTATAIMAERAASAEPGAREEALRSAATAVRESLEDVRRIARELRPEALDDLGLVNALLSLCRRMDAQSGVRVRLHTHDALPELQPDTEVVLYRIAQESLTNVIRHAGARTADVSLTVDAAAVVLRIRDDGDGLAPGTVAGTGIAGMRERAMLAGGRLELRSVPGDGTIVELRIPLSEVACPSP